MHLQAHFRLIIPAAVLLPMLAVTASAQRGSAGADWRYISGDAGGTKYSPLAQIEWRWCAADSLRRNGLRAAPE